VYANILARAEGIAVKKANNGLLSGIIAAAVFLIVFLVLGLPLLISLVLAVVGLAAGWILLPTKKPEAAAAEAEVKDSLAEGRQKLSQIRALGRNVQNPQMSKVLAEVCGITEKILGTIAADPKKLKLAKQFLNYYLDSTLKIMTIYAELASKNVHDATIQAELAKVEAMLGTIKDAFEKQLAKLLSGEVMDLDVELSLLQQTINMEGLGKNP
jgi:5-bromo-4-chloroindolyl phosphate hydrolysis protein